MKTRELQYEEEDTCITYEEENTCMTFSVRGVCWWKRASDRSRCFRALWHSVSEVSIRTTSELNSKLNPKLPVETCE
jgi:hypothetical protein